MTKLLYFTKIQERRRYGVFVCFRMEKRKSLYSNGGENINWRSFNEGWQRIKENNLFQYLEKASALNVEVGESDEQTKWPRIWFFS